MRLVSRAACQSATPLAVQRTGTAGEADEQRMAGKKKDMKNIGHEPLRHGRHPAPDWASGLRRLYDSVVEEPLPDSFAKLLDDLDSADA